MKVLLTPLIDRQQWLEEFSLQHYSPDQQRVLWDLITRAIETQAMDVLLDRLNQADQRALIQYLAEDELEDQLEVFLNQKIPDHQELLRGMVIQYKKQLRRDLARVGVKS